MLIGVVVVLTSLAVSGTTYHYLSRELVGEALGQLRDEARIAALRFDVELESLRDDAEFLSEAPPVRGYFRAMRNGGVDPVDGSSTPANWRDRLESIFATMIAANPEYRKIRLIAADEDGHELLSVVRTDLGIVRVAGDALRNEADSHYFVEALGNPVPDRLYLSRVDLDREFGEIAEPLTPVMRAVLPVSIADEEAAVAIVVITLAVDEFFARTLTGREGDRRWFVIDERGDFVVHPDSARRFPLAPGGAWGISDEWPDLADATGIADIGETYSFRSVDGREHAAGTHLLAYDPQFPDRQLLFVSTGSLASVSAPLARLRREIGLAAIGVLVLALVLTTLLARALTRRLSNLTAGARAVAAGDYGYALGVGGDDEIGELARAMSTISSEVNDKVERLSRTETELRESRDFLNSILDNVPAMVFVKDAEELRYVRLNRAAEEITGRTAEDFIGKNDFDCFTEEEARAFTEADRQVLAIDQPVDVGEKVITHKDGSQRWVRATKVAVRGANGTPRYLLGIAQDITAQRQVQRGYEEHLIAARQLAEAANRAKSDFLATMSHELRTPLNAIIGYSELLAEDAADRDELADVAEDLDKIRSAGRHLLSLINDVLDLAKIEAGRVELEVEAVAMQEFVDDVANTVRTLIEANKNTFVVDCRDVPETIDNDPTKLRQILINLLSNAAKFTSGGTIELGVSTARNPNTDELELVMRVSDTGIGIPNDKLEYVFEAFSQADSKTTRRYGGTGLGLAITRRSCELLGGAIWATSEVDVGSEFTVRLPANLPVEQSAAPEPATAADRGERRSGAVLVIDDNEAARQLLSDYLRNAGWEVAVASSGEEGLRLAAELHPAAIVLDIIMPEMDGWTVLERLKGDAELAEIPVVFCTITDEKQRGFMLGASDYLTKPVERDRFVSTLAHYCARPGAKLLLVEDDEATRDIFRRTATDLGWMVDEAENGIEALESISRERPDLIVLDLMMPELDGFGVIDALQESDTWRDIPVVIATAKTLTDDDHNRLNGFVQKIVSKSDVDAADIVASVADELRALEPDLRSQ